MSYQTIIKRAADIIRDPKHWTIGTSARNTSGQPTMAISSTAACWCARGAIVKACREQPQDQRPHADTVVNHIQDNHLHRMLWQFNDDPSTKHQDVIDLLDKAAK